MTNFKLRVYEDDKGKFCYKSDGSKLYLSDIMGSKSDPVFVSKRDEKILTPYESRKVPCSISHNDPMF